MNHLLSRQNKGKQAPFLTRRLNRRLKVTSWQDDRSVVLITPTPSLSPLRAEALVESVQSLYDQGVTRCMTPAIAVADAEPFFKAGFTLRERLHLLALNINPASNFEQHAPDAELTIRSARRRHESQVLALDNVAFDEFWSFNGPALRGALKATPNSRYRVAVNGKIIVGYAVTGQASKRGYLQRLAVDPSLQGQQIGTSLIYDALRWLQQRGALKAFVNTQESNTRAFALYRHLGFEQQRDGLLVLSWESPA